MRTLLTGFAVAWGIFMLIVLLASGNGLRNGIMLNFGNGARNYVGLWSGRTSMPYKGLPTGRRIRFDQRDLEMLRKQLPEIEYLSGVVYRSNTLTYGNRDAAVNLEGVTSDCAYIRNILVEGNNGRFLNRMDDLYKRKVIVLHPDHARSLFPDEDPIGKFVTSGKIAYQVIGVYYVEEGYDNETAAFIPLSVAQVILNQRWGYGKIEFTVKGLNTLEANEAFKLRLREKMAAHHGYDPKDRSPLGIWSKAESAMQAESFLTMITIFILIIGLASLMAGIVGVGNIMMITVRERTREIGIRKALGATPLSILVLVILEAVFITTCAGYAGIILGVGLTEIAGTMLFSGGKDMMFVNPTVDLGTILYATVFLIVCGVVAGLIPAWKATKVLPIEAMRAE